MSDPASTDRALDRVSSFDPTRPSASVVIPCFNHGRYLPDAIESALRQTLRNVETIVVDDGSSDDTPEVAARYETVRYIRQSNRGLAAARNTGMRASSGEFLCFLDADDLLAPNALEVGVRLLEWNPECAFASGDHRLVGPDLRPWPKLPRRLVERDHYLAFLRGNYVGMHATVVYRRDVLIDIGGFNENMRACEDYDIYLRIAREHQVICHPEVVADYRQHGSNMSSDPEFMLKWALEALHGQWPYVRGNRARELAYREGERDWRQYYGGKMVDRIRFGLRRFPSAGQLLAWLLFIARNHDVRTHGRELIMHLISRVAGRVLPSYERLKGKWLRRRVDLGSFRQTAPLCPDRGELRAWYEAQIVRDHDFLRSDVLRLGTGDTGIGNAGRLPPRSFDAVLCTDLHTCWELETGIATLEGLLRKGGVLLAILPGVTVPDSQTDTHDYWRFTDMSARRLFETRFAAEDVAVSYYGNVLTSIAGLHGLSPQELPPEALDYSDVQQQMYVAVRAVRTREFS